MRLSLLTIALATVSIPAGISIAGTVQVRVTSCPGDPVDESEDTCHETVSAALTWLLAYDTPSASNPGVMDIGAGDFGSVLCVGGAFSHVTFRGVSRTSTSISGVGAQDCNGLAFERLAVKSAIAAAVAWTGTGTSTWNQVDIISPKPWVDSSCHSSTATRHSMRSVRWIGGVPSDYGARIQCGSIDFSLGEIRMFGQGTPPSGSAGSRYAIDVAGRGRLSITKSAVRVGPGSWASSTNWNNGVVAFTIGRAFGSVPAGTPILELTDSVVNVDMSGLTRSNATAIETVGTHAAVSTSTTGFVLARGSAPQGSDPLPARLSIGGSHAVNSKYLWPAASAPPAIRTADGADRFVETDCDHDDANGSCSGGTPVARHLMEYRSAECGTTDPWYDVVRKACRERPPN
jgi:hypothetical protein